MSLNVPALQPLNYIDHITLSTRLLTKPSPSNNVSQSSLSIITQVFTQNHNLPPFVLNNSNHLARIANDCMNCNKNFIAICGLALTAATFIAAFGDMNELVVDIVAENTTS